MTARNVALLFIISGSFAPTPTGAQHEGVSFGNELQRVLDQAIATTGGTGVSAAIATDDGRLWRGVAGMSNPADSSSIHPDMLFAVCSIGKNHVAALTLQLVDEGTIRLEDTVGKWLPPYRHVNPATTIRQLLSHTSGIFDYVEHAQSPYTLPAASIEHSRVWTTDEILGGMVDEPHFAPGGGWKYSTTNYLLLRLILEEVTGTTFSEMVGERLLKPLGLDGTVAIDHAEPVPAESEIVRHWYDLDEDGRLDDLSRESRNWYSIVPHLVYATAEDLARWSRALFRGGVLEQRTLDEMLEFHRPTPDEPFSGYGLGVGEFPSEMVGGETAWGHAGQDFGWTAVMAYFPRLEIHVAVLLNDNNLDTLFFVIEGFVGVARAEAG